MKQSGFINVLTHNEDYESTDHGESNTRIKMKMNEKMTVMQHILLMTTKTFIMSQMVKMGLWCYNMCWIDYVSSTKNIAENSSTMIAFFNYNLEYTLIIFLGLLFCLSVTAGEIGLSSIFPCPPFLPLSIVHTSMMIRKWWGTGYLLYLQPKPWNGWNRENMSFNVQPCSSLLVSLQPMETAGRLQKVAVMAVTTVTVVLPWESVNIPQDHRESLKCPVCMPIKCETLYTIISCPCPWGGAVWRQSQCQNMIL